MIPCRDCGSGPLDTVLDLGLRAISTFPRAGDPLAHAPLHLAQCPKPTCGLVQLADTVDPTRLFAGDYWYRSGINETMVAELQSVVDLANHWVPIGRGSILLDIGANDGTLLRGYSQGHRIAVEPSPTFAGDLLDLDEYRASFFPDPQLIDEFRGRVRVVTSIACLYDLDDPHAFVQGVADLLARGGIWIVQFQDLAQMLAATAVDNLCHEHLFYPSLRSIEHLIQPHGLEVVYAERRAINGGSLRLIIGKAGDGGWLRSTTVGDLRKAEAGCQDWETLAKFSWRATRAATQVRACIDPVVAMGRTIDLYGASTKGNTLLQLAGLGPAQIRQAWERSPAKVGRQTVTGIPIVSEEIGRADPPDVFLCGIWQFREAVLQREWAVLRGRSMIFPLPEVDVVHVGQETVA